MQDIRFDSRGDWVVKGWARFHNADISGILEHARTEQEAWREVDRLSEDLRYHDLRAEEKQ